ncbi:MAG: helix-turn-helix domain-containing protein [Endomicrobium sp.]|jgi:transcriptional regulator with XRE-family HTH domain|nr:helix-turn-helix domain-containing protein [Endomicrobium sp.]
MEQKKEFGKRIKKAALDADLSLKDLGAKLNVSRQMISQWTSGNRNPKTDSLRKIAKATNKPLSYFFDDNIKEQPSDLDLIKKELENLNLKYELLKKEFELIKKNSC